jgi:hypothetical protein
MDTLEEGRPGRTWSRAGLGIVVVTACFWCGKNFKPRANGGKTQRFCRPLCRRVFDAAGRRWVAEAIAAGTLTIGMLRNDSATTRALTGIAGPPAAAPEAEGEQDALGALVDEALSVDETAALPETVGLLLQFVAALRAEKPPDA